MRFKTTSVFILLFVLFLFMAALAESSTINLLTDIKVAYIYDRPEDVDWALLYYLGVDNGCHIDLVSVKSGPTYRTVTTEARDYNLTVRRFFITDSSSENMEKMATGLFSDFPPDIVIFGSEFKRPETKSFADYLLNLDFDSLGIEKIKKYYRQSSVADNNSIYIKSKQFIDNYYPAISEMARALSSHPLPTEAANVYTAYNLIKSNIITSVEAPTFLAGIERFKFDKIIGLEIKSTVRQTALKLNRKKYIEYLDKAIASGGRGRLESLLAARLELKKIRETYYYQVGKVDSTTPVGQYIERTMQSLSEAIFNEAGISHDGQAIIRDTPEGRRLKFKSEINNDGLLNIRSGQLSYRKHGADNNIIIDSGMIEIPPNNSLIREYNIPLDQSQLESMAPSDLVFTGEVIYGDVSIDFDYETSIYRSAGFSIELVPDFLIIEPFKELKGDRLVEQASMRALIRKPSDFSGKVNIKVTAPHGIVAGALKDDLVFNAGERVREISVPVVATRSMGNERRGIEVSVNHNGQTLASATAYALQIDFDLDTKKPTALLPDYAGILEDILMSAGANYKIVSDHYLKAGNFNLYNLIIFGTDCFKNYLSLDLTYDKMKTYLEYGGEILVFGQSDQWRDDLLPVSLVTASQAAVTDDIRILDLSHSVLGKKNKPDLRKLVIDAGGYTLYPAVVFPGEKIIEGPGGTALLSITKIGKGHLIYCGIPLPELVSDLNPNAIKALSGLLNFSGE
jgi:hypothetical protein